jgi:hypothetical protein
MSYFSFREEWLTAGLDMYRPRIEAAGYKLPDKIKVTCSFPVGSRGGKKTMGQCINPQASAGSITELLVSPTIECPLTALGVVLHELGHACVGVEAGHGPKFKAFCRALGLVGKATQAMPGEETLAWIKAEVLPMLGDYPHSAVDPSQRKKQGTRMIKLICPETGYTVRTTKKWLALGVPTSPAGHEMVVDGEEENED